MGLICDQAGKKDKFRHSITGIKILQNRKISGDRKLGPPLALKGKAHDGDSLRHFRHSVLFSMFGQFSVVFAHGRFGFLSKFTESHLALELTSGVSISAVPGPCVNSSMDITGKRTRRMTSPNASRMFATVHGSSFL